MLFHMMPGKLLRCASMINLSLHFGNAILRLVSLLSLLSDLERLSGPFVHCRETLAGTHVPLYVHAIMQSSNHVATALRIKSCRYTLIRVLVYIHNKHHSRENVMSVTEAWLLGLD